MWLRTRIVGCNVHYCNRQTEHHAASEPQETGCCLSCVWADDCSMTDSVSACCIDSAGAVRACGSKGNAHGDRIAGPWPIHAMQRPQEPCTSLNMHHRYLDQLKWPLSNFTDYSKARCIHADVSLNRFTALQSLLRPQLRGLLVLDCSNNLITSLEGIGFLKHLHVLIAANNCITSTECLAGVAADHRSSLRFLDLRYSFQHTFNLHSCRAFVCKMFSIL
jgi:hypothetical protein